MPRPTTSVRRSDGSRGAGRPIVAPGRAGEAGEEGVAGADENGGRDMFCASLSGAGRKGGTPSPLSNDGWAAFTGDIRKSESGFSALEPSTGDGRPAGSEVSVVTGVGSSGLRRLNKTLYQTESGASAYHGASLSNNNPFGLFI
jgi:hypothetical protein